MKNIHFCTVVLALISVVAGQSSVSCGSTNCGAGDECCSDRVDGQLCFNPTNFACVLDEKLCPIDQNVCFDTVCFDPNIHVCLSNGLNQFLCPKGTIGCGSNNVCLEPNNYVCLNGEVSKRPSPLQCGSGSCESPQQCCNGNCFDPTTQTCAIAEGVAGLVCPINSMGKANGVCNLASGAVCYDMDTQRCLVSSTGHQLCSIGEPGCAAATLAAARQEIPPSMLQTSIGASVQASAIAIATSAQISQATSIGNSAATSAVMPSVSVAASVFSSIITSLANAATAIVTSVVSTTTAIIEATASTTTATVAVTSALPTSATVVTTQTVAVETSTAVLVTAQGSGAPPPAVALVSLFFGLLMLIV